MEHGQGIVTPIAALLAALGAPSFAAWLLKRATLRDENRELLIDALRKALDKGRVRENAYCGALDALVIGIDHLEDPHPALIAARSRALEIMETAHCHINGGAR